MIKTIMTALSKRYQQNVANRLRPYGLKYDDLLIEEYPEVQEALKRLDPKLLEARNRRMARAGDLSMKGKSLPQHIQDQYDPLDRYLSPIVEQVQLEMKERKNMNKNILS